MINYSYLRPKKRNSLQNWHKRSFSKRFELECPVFENASILPIKRLENESLQFGHGGVITEEGNFVESSGIEGRVGGFYKVDNIETSSETVVYCGFFIRQWGHFLIETISRLWYLLETKEGIDKYIFVVRIDESCELSGNYREFFDLLGISDKVAIINRPKTYHKVYVPELGYSRKHYYSNEYQQIFDKVIHEAYKQPSNNKTEWPERVFLSRNQFSKARETEVGLDMLDNFFTKNGYMIIHPEMISLTELILYLQNATICAAESGTLPHNFLFAQQGKECIVIERQAIANEIQANIDVIKQLNVVYIDGHFTIYPTIAGFGPFFLAYNSLFEQFSNDFKLIPPDQNYLDDHYIKRCLKWYLSAYRRAYGYNWGIESWMMIYADCIYEAYEDSKKVLGKYLSGERPFLFRQFFSMTAIKSFGKKMLKKKHVMD